MSTACLKPRSRSDRRSVRFARLYAKASRRLKAAADELLDAKHRAASDETIARLRAAHSRCVRRACQLFSAMGKRA